MSEAVSNDGLGVDLDQLLGFPAALPPKGVIPNFKNPESFARQFNIIGGVLTGVMLAFVLCRYYAKLRIARKFTWDDLTCALAVLFTLTSLAGGICAVNFGGMGKHQWDLLVKDIVSPINMIGTTIFVCFTTLGVLFAKLTFFIMYLNLFWPLRWLRLLVFSGGSVVVAFYIGTIITFFYFGTPGPSETWLSHAESSKETKEQRLSVPVGCVNAGTDLFILILPIYAVWQLQLSTRRKLGVVVVFLGGVLACVASLAGIYYRVYEAKATDLTWAIIPLEILQVIELNVGLSCACVPAFAQVLRHHLPPFENLKLSFLSGWSSLRSTIATHTPGSRSKRRRRYPKPFLPISSQTTATSGSKTLRSGVTATQSSNTTIITSGEIDQEKAGADVTVCVKPQDRPRLVPPISAYFPGSHPLRHQLNRDRGYTRAPNCTRIESSQVDNEDEEEPLPIMIPPEEQLENSICVKCAQCECRLGR